MFLDNFLNSETDGESSTLADGVVGAIIGHHGNVPEVNKSSAQVEDDCRLGTTGDHLICFDLTAAQTTLLTNLPWMSVDNSPAAVRCAGLMCVNIVWKLLPLHGTIQLTVGEMKQPTILLPHVHSLLSSQNAKGGCRCLTRCIRSV